MNGSSSRAQLKSSFRASPASIRPLYTGGPVLLTRDGEWLITTMGEEVLITEIRTGRGVARVRGDTTAITALALSYHTSPPTLVTCHQSNTIRYYPLPEGLPTTPKPPSLQYVRALPRAASAPILVATVAPDSTLLATGSSDGVVKVWDLAGGYVTHMFRGHGGPVSALHFSFPTVDDDKQQTELWTGSVDSKVRVFDLRDASTRVVVGGSGGGGSKPKAVLDGHVSVVRGIAVSEDGRWAVTGGRDKVVLVWDLGDPATTKKGKGKSQAPKVVQTIIANEQVEACGLLPPGQEVVGSSEGRLLCYTAGDAGSVRVWDVLKATEVAEMRTVEGVDEDGDEDDEQRGIISVIYDATDSALVSVHADQNITFHSLTTLSPIRQIVGFNDDIVDAAFLSHEGGQESTHVALATNSSLVRVYSTGTFDARLLSGHRDMVLCLDRSSDGRWLVTGSKDRTARVWAPTGEGERGGSGWRCVAVCEGHAEAVGAVVLSKKTADGEGRFLFTASQDRTIKMWDLSGVDENADEPIKARSLATMRIAEKDINSLDLAPNDRFLASGSQDKLVKLFEVDFTPGKNGGAASGAVTHIGTCKGHRRGVWTVKFSRNDRIVASGAADRTIKLWSLDDFSCLKTFEGHTNSVLRIDFMTQGMQLVSSASDGLVKLWNIRDEECVATLDNHEDKVWALAVSPNEATIVSAGADSVATFWEDSTAVEQEEKNAALIASVQSEQDFNNFVLLKDYRRAILLALAMGQPGRLLGLFRAVLASAGAGDDAALASDGSASGSPEVDEVIRTLPPLDLVRLLKHVRDWNANAKTAPIAQAVLNAVLRLRAPEDILAAFDAAARPAKAEAAGDASDEEDAEADDDPDAKIKAAQREARKKAQAPINMRDLLDGLVPYTERHMARLDRLLQESYVLDYSISEMDGGVFGTEVMDVDV